MKWRLLVALAFGPAATARTLSSLLSRDRNELSAERTADWVADYFSAELSTSLRHILRDGTVQAIRRIGSEESSSRLLLNLLSLASEIELLADSSNATEERLLTTAYQWARAGHRIRAAHVAGLIASEGKRQSDAHWTIVYNILGVESAAACAFGVYRHGGAFAALDWIRLQVYGEAGVITTVALLPKLAAEARQDLIEYMDGLDDAIFLSRILDSINFLGVSVPVPSPESFLAQIARIPSELIHGVLQSVEIVRAGFDGSTLAVLSDEKFLTAMDSIDSISHSLAVAPLLAISSSE